MEIVFEEEKPQSFWMKNTAIALDMAFINSALEIVALQKYVPVFTEEGRSCGRSRRRARYVPFPFYYQNCYQSTEAVRLFLSKQASI